MEGSEAISCQDERPAVMGRIKTLGFCKQVPPHSVFNKYYSTQRKYVELLPSVNQRKYLYPVDLYIFTNLTINHQVYLFRQAERAVLTYKVVNEILR